MRVPYEWLRDYCAPAMSLDAVADRLTLSGTRVNSLDDGVFELEVMPNRPDCLGVYGVARELHAATGARLASPPWANDIGTPGPVAALSVSIDSAQGCPRLAARVFEAVHVTDSPDWLQRRLVASGIRPVNSVVDIASYATLLSGHPAHALDLDRVAGENLTVRHAHAGETLETADGQVRALGDEMLVIADDDGAVAIGGVIDGARTQVDGDTSRVVIEASAWSAPMVQRASRVLGLQTATSSRHAKGLAPEQALEGLCTATRLMVEVAGTELLPGTIDIQPAPSPSSAVVRLRTRRVSELLGVDVPAADQRDRLEALGFGVAVDGQDQLDVTVPPHRRNDITQQADLVEEIGRFALHHLPATLPPNRPGARLSLSQRQRRRALDALVGCGMHEAVGWSFADPALPDRLRLPADDPRRRLVVLENPMSARHSALRTVLLGSLLDVARTNLRHGHSDLRLFEAGNVYQQVDEQLLPDERRRLCALVHGRPTALSWDVPLPTASTLHAGEAYAVKGVLDLLAGALRVPLVIDQTGTPEPFLHPGRAGHVLVDGQQIGWIGTLHPAVSDAWTLGATGSFELDLDALVAHADGVPFYRDFSLPIEEQDLAIVVAYDTPASHVLEIVRRHATQAEILHVYTGSRVAPGEKSLTVRCGFPVSAHSHAAAPGQGATPRERVIDNLVAIGARLLT